MCAHLYRLMSYRLTIYSIFALFSVYSTLLILFYISQNILPALSALALIRQMLAYIALYSAIKFAASIDQQPKYLAYNVASTLLTPLTIVITVFIN